MFRNVLKIISPVLVLAILIFSQNAFAQSDAKQIIKSYQNGELTNPTSGEKQIIQEYLESIQKKAPYYQKRVLSPNATTYIDEDFSSATGITPPTGWTQNIISGPFSWYFDNPGGRILNAPITDPAAIFDSDFNGGGAENVALESPTFSPPAATTVLMEWDQYFNGGFGGTANVEVWNGASWVSVYTTTVSTSNPDHRTIDISSNVAGVTNAQVRFRWTGDYSWYWIVDNVFVNEPAATPNPAVLVAPPNTGVDVSINTNLNWVSGGGTAPTGYRIYFGTNGGGVTPPTNIANNVDLGLVTTYTPALPLAYSTTYYWEIIPYNGAGDATGNVIWSFTTGADPTITTFPYTESFDNVAFPPYGWGNTQINLTGLWTQVTTGTYPTCNPHSGTGMAKYGCFSYSTGTSAILVTPPINFPGDGYRVSFWMYRDPGYASSADKVDIQFNTSPNLTGATLLGTINRSMSLDPVVAAEGWYQYSFNVPSGTIGDGYIIFQGTSAYGNNIYVDDVTVDVAAFGNLNGTITNCFTTDPLDGATVMAGLYSTTTNPSGYYEFLNIPTGSYDVTASKLGYADNTVTGVTVTGGTTTQNICLNELLFPPSNLQASVTGQNVNLTWQPSDADRWVRCDNGVNSNAVGLTAGGTFEVSARFPSSVTLPLAGKVLTQMEIYIWDIPSNCTIKIYDQGTSTSPGIVLHSEDITSQITGSHSWYLITLNSPVPISGNDIWIGYEATAAAGLYPAGCDAGPVAPDGDWLYIAPDWMHAGYGNWNIAGYVTSPGPEGTKLSIPLAYNSTDRMEKESLLLRTENEELKKIEFGKGMFTAVHGNMQSVSQFVNNTITAGQQNKTGMQHNGSESIDATFTGYNVYRDNVEIIHNTANLFYNDLSLPYGTYSYKVTSQYLEGESAPAGPVVVSVVPPPAGIPFTENFDGTWPGNWMVLNGTQTNQWFVGTAAVPFSSPNSAYISNDGGITYFYNNTATSVVHMFRDITFSGSVGGGYQLKFQWKAYGESCCDYLQVFLVETSVTPTPGVMLTTGQLGVNYNVQTDYTQATISLPESLTGSTKRLVFSWKNDFSIGDQPASIDDIDIEATQTGTLNGTVTNCYTTSPLNGATVIAGTYSTTTNASGFYSLTVANGTYDVTASKAGYNSTTVTGVVVPAGGTTTQNICLNEMLAPPANLQASVTGQDVNLTWQAPLGPPDYTIRWDDGVNYDAIGTGGAVNFDVASRWPVTDISPYNGKYLKKVLFYPYQAAATYTIEVWQGADVSSLTLVYSQVVTSPIINAWNEVTLITPVQIDGTQELWFGYNVNTTTGYPAGCDNGPQVAGKGNMIYWSGAWAELTALNPALTYNWNIAGLVYNNAAKGTEHGIPLAHNLNSSTGPNRESLSINTNKNQTANRDLSDISFTSVRNVKPTFYSDKTKKLGNGEQILYRGINATLTGYNVYRDGLEIIHNTPNLLYNDLALPYGTYSYTVKTQYLEGESPAAGPVIANVVNPSLITDTLLVYPQSSAFWTGNTEGTTKTDGEINTVYPKVGWAAFNISAIPSNATISAIKFNGYINANNYPYWSITPLGSVNPVTDDAVTIHTAVNDGYLNSYIDNYEPTSLPIGWISRPLGNTAPTDMQNALAQGWFAMGFLDFDFYASYYINFDGWSQANPPYLEVIYQYLAANTFPLNVNVSNGWNMVSVPGINPDGQGINNWWINHTGTVYKFVPGSGYSGIATTAPGEGYWMKNAGAETYNYPAIQIVPHDPINVAAKWNMFGGFEDIVDATALTTTPPGQIVSIYKFVPGQGYQPAAQIVPGYGYWVKVSTACQINIPDVSARGNQKAAELFKDDWGRITLTDAAGSSYTLYTVKGEVDLDQYELPPLPPAGLFDVRFSSGRAAEDINSAIQAIEMRGMTYPVKVKVENTDIRLQDVTGKQINENVKSGEEITISNANIDKIMVSEQLIPDKYSLEQNYPNPFNPSTTIEFSLPENVKTVKVTIYNVLGQKVAELVNGSMPAGKYQYQWDAKDLASGMYIYELRTDKFVSIKKMMFLK